MDSKVECFQSVKAEFKVNVKTVHFKYNTFISVVYHNFIDIIPMI